jgi:hypothetical protein
VFREERFLDAGGDVDVSLRVAWGDLRGPAAGEQVFDAGSLWQLYRDDTDYLFRFTSSHLGPLPYKECRFSADFNHGEVLLNRDYLNGDKPIYPLEHPVDELLIVNLLAQGHGVVVHACGVEDSDGRGYLFVGESKAGKSTTARLWDKAGGARILSDDRIIVRLQEGRLWIYGTPWHSDGGYAISARASLDHIYFLKHGKENSIQRLSNAEAVARLMACSFLPFYSPAGLDFSLAFFQRVIKTIPAEQLRFVPDERAVEFIRGQQCG